MEDEKLIAPGGAIKALSDDRIGGYLVLWGDPEKRDLQGEYFTPETDFKLDYYPNRPVLYHHGMDGSIKAEKIGTIDTITPDDTGLWIEAQLDSHNQWVRAVKELIQRGVLGWSSGSAPNLVEVVKGWIKTWPIIEGSTTPSPAEPRGVNVVSLKTYLEQLLLEAQDEPDTAIEPETPVKEPETASKAESDIPESQPIEVKAPLQEINNMNLQDVIMSILDILAGQGVELSAEQRAAVAEQVMAAYQQTEEPVAANAVINEEEKAAQVAQALAPIVAKAAADFLAAEKTRKDALKAAVNGAAGSAVKDAIKPASKANGYTGNHNISMRTEFADMTPEDMSYYVKFRNATRARQGLPAWVPDAKFMRELADKAGKAYEAGQLRFGDKKETESAVKSINAYKSAELDYSTQSGYGDEWVPDLWASQVWERARLDNVILPLFQNVEMPSNPFELPVETTDPTVYYVPETTAESELTLSGSGSVIPDSKMATTKVQLNAKKLALRVGFSSELEEDSIIPWIAQLRMQSLRAIEDAIDNVLLNGDTETGATGNVNLVDSTPAATAKYLAFDGIRKLALVTNTANSTTGSGNAPTLAQIRTARFLLARAYAARPQDLAIIVPTETYAKLLALTEFLTMDVIGDRATILSGQIGAIDGIPVLQSNEFPLANTAGKVSNTAGNNTLGSLAIVYKPGWYVGYRRRVNASVDFLPYYDSYQMTATVRLGFINRDTDVASVLYNSLV